MTNLHYQLAAEAQAQLAEIKTLLAGGATDRQSAQLVAGWVEAIRHFAERGESTHAGKVEAAKILAAHRDWFVEVAGEGHGHGR